MTVTTENERASEKVRSDFISASPIDYPFSESWPSLTFSYVERPWPIEGESRDSELNEEIRDFLEYRNRGRSTELLRQFVAENMRSWGITSGMWDFENRCWQKEPITPKTIKELLHPEVFRRVLFKIVCKDYPAT